MHLNTLNKENTRDDKVYITFVKKAPSNFAQKHQKLSTQTGNSIEYRFITKLDKHVKKENFDLLVLAKILQKFIKKYRNSHFSAIIFIFSDIYFYNCLQWKQMKAFVS